MPTAEDGQVAAPSGMTFENGTIYDGDDMDTAVAAASAPDVVVDADFTAGQNLNQTAGTLAVSTPLSITGDPTRVEISFNIHGVLSNSVSGARVAPVMELYRGATHIATAATGYIRDSNDHEENSYNVHFVDTSPGTDPSYSVQTRRDSTVTQTLPCTAPSTIQLIGKF